MSCTHKNAVVKRYVGSTETYNYCPDCWETFGGEETKAKKALLAAAVASDPGEQGEVEGKV